MNDSSGKFIRGRAAVIKKSTRGFLRTYFSASWETQEHSRKGKKKWGREQGSESLHDAVRAAELLKRSIRKQYYAENDAESHTYTLVNHFSTHDILWSNRSEGRKKKSVNCNPGHELAESRLLCLLLSSFSDHVLHIAGHDNHDNITFSVVPHISCLRIGRGNIE